MRTLKYIILLIGGKRAPILLSPDIMHCEAVSSDMRSSVVSAGMVRLSKHSLTVYGGSETLGVESKPGDTDIIRTMLNREKNDDGIKA